MATTVGGDTDTPKVRPLRLRYPGTCASCGLALARGAEAWYTSDKRVLCAACGPIVEIPETIAGASAAAEGERRKVRRVESVRRAHGDLAAAVAEVLVNEEIDSTWGKGSQGESWLAGYVAKRVGDAVIPLHDRLIPGTKTNIDHLFVSEIGVWVVDAKNLSGNVVRKEVGPLWRRENQLFVGGRNRTKLVASVERQVRATKVALTVDPDLHEVPVFSVLCFTHSDWGLFNSGFMVSTVWATSPRALCKRLKKSGPLSRDAMMRIAARLALSLPSASQPSVTASRAG